MIILGSSALQRSDSSALLAAARRVAENAEKASGAGSDWKVFNVLHRVSIID